MSILSFNQVSLIVAGNQILHQTNWQIQARERIALVGRNGAGKSTLLKLLQGEMVPDQGNIQYLNGLRIHGLTQEVPIYEKESVYHFLTRELGPAGEVIWQLHQAMLTQNTQQITHLQHQAESLNVWHFLPKIDAMASRLSISIDRMMSELSGGMKRRVLLAAALIAEPDLLLLDEPTNHLDLQAIEWLEAYLRNYHGSVVVVSHDREFLDKVTQQIVEIDRGKLYTYHCNYATYIERRNDRLLIEQKHDNLFDKHLAEEEAWIRTGIKARRTRNEGRVRALKALRVEYKERRAQMAKMNTVQLMTITSGQVVLDAKNLNYRLPTECTKGSPSHDLIQNVSLLLTRGDKIGIIGPNGCGKTTLVRLLLGELSPDAGTIKLGTNLEIAYFDQLRRQLNEQQTVMANVAEGADYVTIQGKSKHVASYLQEFLFTSDTFNKPVSILSGGEKNRLLLAKLFAKPFNLLVMDEPTNDLDIDTLELLESLLVEYKGTLILISHDRAFINNVVTSVLVYEGNGQFNEYLGGYDDYLRVKQQQKPAPPLATTSKSDEKTPTAKRKLNFNEQRELKSIPQEIEALEQKIQQQQLEMTNSSFYQQESDKIALFKQRLLEDEARLSQLYQRWEELE